MPTKNLNNLQTGGGLARRSRNRVLHGGLLDGFDQKLIEVLQNSTSRIRSCPRTTGKKPNQPRLRRDPALVHDGRSPDSTTKGDRRFATVASAEFASLRQLAKLKDSVVQAHLKARFTPPDRASFASQAGGNAANLGDLYDVCVAEGLLARISPEVYLHASVEAEMRKLITEKLTGGPGMTVAEIRDLLGTTRKYAVPLCEYLDRIGLTRREGDLRVLNK